jgi:hypothetical protein
MNRYKGSQNEAEYISVPTAELSVAAADICGLLTKFSTPSDCVCVPYVSLSPISSIAAAMADRKAELFQN